MLKMAVKEKVQILSHARQVGSTSEAIQANANNTLTDKFITGTVRRLAVKCDDRVGMASHNIL